MRLALSSLLTWVCSTNNYNPAASNLNSSYSLKHEKRKVRNLKKKMTLMVVGVILILIALILGALQHFYYGPKNENIYGSGANKWYFYVLVGIIGLIGVVLVAWSLIIIEAPAKTTQPTQPAK
jgi:hypothetical protein